MDYRQLSQELVRAMRGKRSHSALSRRLGFKTNVVYTWESGRCSPPIGDFLRFAEMVGRAHESVVRAFYRGEPPWGARRLTLAERARLLLCDQRRNVALTQLSRSTGASRFALRRWFEGEAEPRLHEYLNVLNACSRRLLDFIAELVNPELLPTLEDEWRILSLARQAAYQLPWSQAVLRVLETQDYKHLPAHEPGWIANRLDIPLEQEQESLELLAKSRQIALEDGRYQPLAQRALNLRTSHADARRLAAWWVKVASSRTRNDGMFAYNICGVTKADLERIQALQVDFLKQVRAIVAESEPVEHVALVAVQVFALDATTKGSAADEQT